MRSSVILLAQLLLGAFPLMIQSSVSDSVTTKPVSSTKDRPFRSNWFKQSRRSKRSSSSSSSIEKNSPPNPDAADKNLNATKSLENDIPSNSTMKNETVTADATSNATRTSAFANSTERPAIISYPMSSFGPMQMQPQPPGVIVMGLDGRQQRVPSRSPGQPSPSNALIAEAIATIVSTAVRFWFLTSITRWFADEEIKSLKKPTQHFLWERLNDRYAKDSEALQTAMNAPPSNVPERQWRRSLQKKLRKERRTKTKANNKGNVEGLFNRTVIIVEFSKFEKDDLDFRHLEQVVTFVLAEHRRKVFRSNGNSELEVVFLVESPGGGVSSFGLGAAQIRRLTEEEGIVTTACVDRVAASGGYMIASQCHKLIAAPFATLGSIGVIREGLNFNKALEKYGVSPIVMTAGEAKAPLTTYGEITKRGMEISQRQLEKTHEAFRELVVRGRPNLAASIEEVADGDIFLGSEAMTVNLVDDVMTSEEYILDRIQAGDRVLKLHHMPQFLKNKRLSSIHPLDFLREHGQSWLAKQDIAKIVSHVVQTTSFLKFVQYVMRNRMAL